MNPGFKGLVSHVVLYSSSDESPWRDGDSISATANSQAAPVPAMPMQSRRQLVPKLRLGTQLPKLCFAKSTRVTSSLIASTSFDTVGRETPM
jgi:hypothetical protein